MTFDPKGKEVEYLNKGFEKVIANFVGIKTDCSRYSSFFLSKSQLYKHLKTSYVRVVQATSFFPT